MIFQNEPADARSASSTKRNLILCLLLVAGSLAVYNTVSQNGFVNYDDDTYIVANHNVQAGLSWSTVRWAFTSLDAANWHPLTWLSHALDYQLFKANPAGHHYVNVLLHAINVVLLFLILFGATGRTWPSLVVAAIFAVHPLNVESVAWASERKNVLSMLFLLLALWAYQSYVRKPGIGRYGIMVVCFACGLMSKPQVITFPFILLLWDYWPLRRLSIGSKSAESNRDGTPSFSWLLLEKVPLLALSLTSALVTLKAQKSGGAVRSVLEYPLGVRVENGIAAYLGYMGKLLWPVRLAAMYPHPGNSLSAGHIAVAALFVIVMTAMIVAFLGQASQQKGYLAAGWFWFLGTLVPMLGLVQVGHQAMADRYMYLPMIGLLLMLSWGLADWAGGHRFRVASLAGVCVLVLGLLSVLTYRQVAFWRSSESLWSHAIAVTKGNFIAHVNLGETLINHGRTEEAAAQFRAATRIRPNDPAAHLNLGTCERRQGDYASALVEDQAVLRLTSDKGLHAYAFVNLGSDYRHLKDYARAKESYQAALTLNPETARAYIGLGVLAQRDGQFGEAAKNYSRAVELEPSDVGYLLLAQALQQNGQAAASQAAWDQARRISPDFDHAQAAVRELQTQ